MSYGDDSQNQVSEYWDTTTEEENQTQAEPQEAQAAEAPAFDPSKYVPVEQFQQTQQQFQQTQQQLQQMQQGLSQALGTQAEQSPQWDPEGAKVADKFLESKGYMTQEAYRTERANEVAQESGYVNSQHLESAFNNMFFEAQSKGNTQLEAELTKIGQAYQQGNVRGAIKQFEAIKGRTQAPVQNQTFGHQPSQQASPKTEFADERAFDKWLVSQSPEKYNEVMETWARTGKAPYPTS